MRETMLAAATEKPALPASASSTTRAPVEEEEMGRGGWRRISQHDTQFRVAVRATNALVRNSPGLWEGGDTRSPIFRNHSAAGATDRSGNRRRRLRCWVRRSRRGEHQRVYDLLSVRCQSVATNETTDGGAKNCDYSRGVVRPLAADYTTTRTDTVSTDRVSRYREATTILTAAPPASKNDESRAADSMNQPNHEPIHGVARCRMTVRPSAEADHGPRTQPAIQTDAAASQQRSSPSQLPPGQWRDSGRCTRYAHAALQVTYSPRATPFLVEEGNGRSVASDRRQHPAVVTLIIDGDRRCSLSVEAIVAV